MPAARTGPMPLTSRNRSAVASITSNTFSPKVRRSFFRINGADAPDHDPLTGCNGCGMADNGNDITMPARLGPQNAKAILDIMVRDALDETSEHLLRRFLRRGPPCYFSTT